MELSGVRPGTATFIYLPAVITSWSAVIVKFATFTSCSGKLEATSSRNEMTALLARLLARAAPDEIDVVCYFTLGAIAPGYSGVNLGIGDRTAAAAIALATGTDPASVEAAAGNSGTTATPPPG